jgi:hypothetical protein
MIGRRQRTMGFGCKFSFYDPDPQLFKDDLDHFLVFDDADDPHGFLTFRTDPGIYFIYLLNSVRLIVEHI